MKSAARITLLLAALGASACATRPHAPSQIAVGPVEKMPALPQPYELRDWRQVARDFDSIAFDRTRKGEFLPLLEPAHPGPNFQGEWLGMRAYVGQQKDGDAVPVEALTMMGSVLGSTLAGIDKRHDPRGDFVKPLKAFFNHTNGEDLFLNRTTAKSGDSFWYVLTPNILAWQLGTRYPGAFDAEMDRVAGRFLEASKTIRKSHAGKANFDFTGWNFLTQTASDNGRWREPDGAAGFAWINHMAWLRSGDEAHLQAANEALDFLDQRPFEKNPLYEVVLPFGVYTAARLNAETGSDHDVSKLLHWCFGPSETRFGWGIVDGRWGDFDVAGLGGSHTDSQGFGFTMNTFLSAGTLAPVARYDDRFARAMGRYLLNATNSARLLYPGALPAEQQSSHAWAAANDPANCLAYEGLRHKWDGKAPYATGDPVRLGWGKTDIGLYGSGYVGFLAAMVEPTDVAEIPGFNLLATETSPPPAFPTTLYYNPHGKKATITLRDQFGVDLYDTVSNRFLVRSARGNCRLELPADSAMIVVRIPEGSKLERRDGKLLAGGVVVDYSAPDAQLPVYPDYAALTNANPIDRSRVLPVPKLAIVADGDPKDWAQASPGSRLALSTAGRGPLDCTIQFAWDENSLHVLVRENRADPTPTEAPDAAAFAQFWDFDSVGLFLDLQNRNELEEIKDACVLLGFSTTKRTDLAGIRTSSTPAFRPLGSDVTVVAVRDAVSGTRIIEASLPWASLVAAVESERRPAHSPAAGWRFGCEPLVADNGWRGQAFVGGAMFSTPTGHDANSIDLELRP